jgi:hypothetical protein
MKDLILMLEDLEIDLKSLWNWIRGKK